MQLYIMYLKFDANHDDFMRIGVCKVKKQDWNQFTGIVNFSMEEKHLQIPSLLDVF